MNVFVRKHMVYVMDRGDNLRRLFASLVYIIYEHNVNFMVTYMTNSVE